MGDPEPEPTPTPQAAPARPRPPETKRVLIVEQDRQVRELLEQFIGQLKPYERALDVTSAQDGADALAILRREAFDLVVLGNVSSRQARLAPRWCFVELPDLVLLRQVRSLDMNVPVIVIGCDDVVPICAAPTRAEALAGGASAYFPLPFDLLELDREVGRWLSRSK